jgi:hypothetical protein
MCTLEQIFVRCRRDLAKFWQLRKSSTRKFEFRRLDDEARSSVYTDVAYHNASSSPCSSQFTTSVNEDEVGSVVFNKRTLTTRQAAEDAVSISSSSAVTTGSKSDQTSPDVGVTASGLDMAAEAAGNKAKKVTVTRAGVDKL